jgi:methylenetetrahydrofolate reductase (NADH)
MFDYPYLVELLSPKRSPADQVREHLDRFAQRYRRILAAGLGMSIPDNPMGQPRYGALETIDLCGLSIDAEKVVMNLNTFHAKDELDALLKKAVGAGLAYLLVVRGDGGPLLPKLDPKSIGGKSSVATSIDLIRYINTAYPEQFLTGAAFNPYNPMPFELKRMEQKIAAGAKFVVTQPIIGRDENVDRLKDLNMPIVVEAWMSKNIDLLYKSVRKEKDAKAAGYDPVENLKALHEAYPECCVYLSMLSFKKDWREVLPVYLDTSY